MKISQLLVKENNNLDLIRFILSCMVIIGHAPFINDTLSTWNDPVNYFFNFTNSGKIAVKFFFFISGLLISNSFMRNKSPLLFWSSRLFRIIPLLLFVLIITSVVIGTLYNQLPVKNYLFSLEPYKYILNNLLFNTSFDLFNVFPNNPMKNAVNGSLWSLRYEIISYFFLFIVFSISRNKYFLNSLILIIVIVSTNIFHLSNILLPFSNEINLLPFCFALGAFFAVNSEMIEIKKIHILVLILLLFIFRKYNIIHLLLILSTSVSILFIIGLEKIKKIKFKYDLSYGIFLWGWPIQQIVYYHFGQINTFMHIVLSLIITIFISYFSAKYIEIPAMNFGKKQFSKKF